eukprot:scaffold318375_cov23-Tisochrysis_lutea.AAC.1
MCSSLPGSCTMPIIPRTAYFWTWLIKPHQIRICCSAFLFCPFTIMLCSMLVQKRSRKYSLISGQARTKRQMHDVDLKHST